MRVLLVDDRADLRRLLELVLSEVAPTWVVVGTAGDGEEAIEKASHLQPDLVLIDASMPVMDGLTALPLLRAALPDATLVLVSALASPRVQLAAAAAGADGFVEKTRLVDELLPALERIAREKSRLA